MTEPRLIILDDEPMVGHTMEGIAEAAGYRVRLTFDADAFFRALREFPPDCVAIDLIMPGMDGVQVMEALARSGCRAGVIITSGSGPRVLDAASRAAAENGLRILGVLHKPFRPAELRALPLRHHRRLRGTGALAASALRPRAAGPLHPAGRVQRPHRRADRAHRVPVAGLVRGPARRARAADRRAGFPPLA